MLAARARNLPRGVTPQLLLRRGIKSQRATDEHYTKRQPLALNFAESHSPFVGDWAGVESQAKHRHHAKLASAFSRLPEHMRAVTQDKDNQSAELTDTAAGRLVERLESRARDAHFRALFESYLPMLRSCEHVVELGCGTGVVMRALLADPEFAGRVTGLDQSPQFITAAEQLAKAEGVPERYKFMVADAQSQPEVVGRADAIVCHTLLSHVNDPAAVLASARKLAQPGTKLVVVDGDYGSLTYAHTANAALGRRMDEALSRAVYTQPDATRRLPELLKETGWKLEDTHSTSISEVGEQADFWLGYAEAYLPDVKKSVRNAGQLTAAEVDRWWAAQQQAVKLGRFFAAATYYTMIATCRE